MSSRIYGIVLLIATLAGGYWHGFVYAPARWPHLSVHIFDLGAILIGASCSYLITFALLMLIDSIIN